jgi:CheY-like chemotaxis protein
MLTVILGYTELALQRTDPENPLFADLEEIKAAADRSAEITRQLLAFSRKQIIAPRSLELNESVEGMLKMLRRLLGEDIDLSWHPGSCLWPVYMDPSQLDQILVNLCVNARDAIADVGKITIETDTRAIDEAYCAEHAGFKPGDFVVIAVSDDGCGMDEQTRAQIFEPFFTTKERGKGTGLGLATVYGIVKQNNGFINVYSEPGQGTTFRIYLPRHLSSGEKEDNHKETAAPKAGGNETILLVEDEPAILEMTRMMLERLGYRVLTANEPAAAIEIVRDHCRTVQLMMTDVVMPGVNGRELAARVHECCPGLKVLFMSGYTANVIAHRGVLGDGVDFIQKPFSMHNLGAKVREVLERDHCANLILPSAPRSACVPDRR